ncbi:MAG: DUF3866 family protein [Acetobacteraceae bacterium]|nr:DUF3866 family protein [Acetobacteraceae bacterium]
MLSLSRGRVRKIVGRRPGATLAEVELEGGGVSLALAYDRFAPGLCAGQEVFLNTTARRLGLGTGGLDFVLPHPRSAPAPAGLRRPDQRPQNRLSKGDDGCASAPSPADPAADRPGPGHVMKLRYTPLQFACLAVEEEASPHHQALKDPPGLGGMPVVACGLHSQIGPVAAALALLTAGRARLAYVMTDGGALPLTLSELVPALRQRRLLCATITSGHAFGGDLEAVNIYSALLAARWAAEADAAVVAMGPGVVGTGTRYGFSGVEQAQVVDAVNALGGLALAVPRLSFADLRPRHRGLSHHTLTALGRLAHSPAVVCLPRLKPPEQALVLQQIAAEPGMARHRLAFADGSVALRALEHYGLAVTTMGRGPAQDPVFFLAAGAAAAVAASYLPGPRCE